MTMSSLSSFSSSQVFISFLVLFLLGSCRNSEAVIQMPKNMTIPALFAFGDSIVDQGNNNNLTTAAKCDFLPYGKDFQGGVPTGRFCNAKTPTDLIASEIGVKELVPAYLDTNLTDQDLKTGVSFASGAAGYDPLTAKLALVYSLSDQLNMFEEYIGKLKGVVGEKETTRILTNGLFLVVAGTDDLANTYFTAQIRKLQYDLPSYTDMMVSQACNFIKELNNLGVRRIAVFGLPPIGCLPSQKTLSGSGISSCSTTYNEAAKLVNTKLSSQTNTLSTTLPTAKVVFIDIYTPFINIIQNPKKYGLEDVERGCCGTGNIEVGFLCNRLTPTCPDDTKYFFWDSYHPTERGYKILVDQIIQKYIKKLS